MPTDSGIVFLVDVDNTLLDNDQVVADLHDYLASEFGIEAKDRYWTIFEELRREVGYADYLGALQRYRQEHLHDPRLLRMSSFLVDYPFPERLFHRSLDVLRHLKTQGQVAILSDGDAVFQPHKVERSGIRDAVEGNVLIYIHKEEMLPDVERHYPAQRYVMVDDKLRLLTSIKKYWGDRVTTVFPRQGHYAWDQKFLSECPPADLTVERISDLLSHDLTET